MKPLILLLILLPTVALSQWRTLVSEDFSNGISGQDLSLLLPWGRQTVPTSAFEINPFQDRNNMILNGVSMTNLARQYGDWHTDTTLRMMNSLDYRFTPIDRLYDTLEVSWTVSWDTTTNSGEAGRINVILLHDYPARGPQVGYSDSINNPSAFGRPAYHLRIVPRTLTGTYNGFMGYGGGTDTLGLLYQFPIATPQFWTPGAVPGNNLPNAGDYPGGQSVTLNTAIAGRKEWRTYTWTVYPEKMTLAWRIFNEPVSANRLVLSMLIPQKLQDSVQTLNRFSQLGLNINRLPQQYNWFRTVEAVRIYGVGQIITRWGGLSVKASQVNPVRTSTTSNGLQLYRLGGNRFRTSRPIQHLKIINLAGQVLPLELESPTAVFSLPELPQGIYYLHAETGPLGKIAQ